MYRGIARLVWEGEAGGPRRPSSTPPPPFGESALPMAAPTRKAPRFELLKTEDHPEKVEEILALLHDCYLESPMFNYCFREKTPQVLSLSHPSDAPACNERARKASRDWSSFRVTVALLLCPNPTVLCPGSAVSQPT